MRPSTARLGLCLALAWLWAAAVPPAQAGAAPEALGPYNLRILQGGIGLSRDLAPGSPLSPAGAPWSVAGWVRLDVAQAGRVVLAGFGEAGGAFDGLVLLDGRPGLGLANGAGVIAPAPLVPGQWRAIAASYDGSRASLYLDGVLVGEVEAATPAAAAHLDLAPALGAPGQVQHFGGALMGLEVAARTLTAPQARALAAHRPDPDLTAFTTPGGGWPVQVHAWTGLQTPQDAWTLPQAKAAPSPPAAVPAVITPPLRPAGDQAWTLGGWRLATAAQAGAGGEVLSRPGYDAASWYVATVPGTVLTTLIDRGVYPDPDHGLNNLAIPEALARQDYWYRTRFSAPAGLDGRRLTLTFQGINYAAEVWLNGTRLGRIKGAFIRGAFDVTGKLRPGADNGLAVRISPPPHPGIPSEESIAYGPGENGGALAMDGPTFIATEGWDWIPGIRDRDTGLWQDVELSASGPVRVLDPNVITRLGPAGTDEADLRIAAEVDNADAAPRAVTVTAAFEGVEVRQAVIVPPGRSEVSFTPEAYPELRVRHPRLWWPNGYGPASLYHLTLTVRDADGVSDVRTARFGMRQITYELSLFDHQGRLRRVEIDPALASERGETVVDPRHQAINRTPNGWAQSLTAAGETSPAARPLSDAGLEPYLVIRVNGVPIAVRGGSWGMDDSRKRVSRDRLEPYFRLHREAHLNTIRNWLGQDTEESFYDLADEYGLLVLNDFWESTEDFQLEAEDPALFLANARDVILRDRHHPSIALWFGRNEGVPQPIINEGLADLVGRLDGARLYTGSSNRVNLQDSGPYAYRPPDAYFTRLGQGFAVEIGTPSLATLEGLKAMIPAADRWPLSDTIAYHDWHFGGNGDVASFMQALSDQFGAPTSLEDFERKAQMMNYVDYRAIFEGFFAHLWTQDSGRLLWMTHPAWPSNHWQIYGADGDTQASYYGTKAANAPLHAQMNLPDFGLAVVNATLAPAPGLSLTSRVLALDGRLIARRTDQVSAPANQVVNLPPLALGPHLAGGGVVLVELVLRDAGGAELSREVYWQSAEAAGLRRLNDLAPQPVGVSLRTRIEGDEAVAQVALNDQGAAPALAVKLTLMDAAGARILPAYYSDNYVSLLPGEPRQVEIRFARSQAAGARIAVRGWNVVAATVGAGR